jgi:hypothetical protein
MAAIAAFYRIFKDTLKKSQEFPENYMKKLLKSVFHLENILINPAKAKSSFTWSIP